MSVVTEFLKNMTQFSNQNSTINFHKKGVKNTDITKVHKISRLTIWKTILLFYEKRDATDQSRCGRLHTAKTQKSKGSCRKNLLVSKEVTLKIVKQYAVSEQTTNHKKTGLGIFKKKIFIH